MSQKRKMDIDDKRKAFALGVIFLMIYIMIYFTFFHQMLGGEQAPWQIVDLILLLGFAVSFGAGLLVVKLRMGNAHPEQLPEDQSKRKFGDE